MFDSTYCPVRNAQEEKNPFQVLSKWTADLLEKVPSHPFPVDVEELPERYQLTAELPGLEKEQLKVQVEEERLSISVHSEQAASEPHHHFIRKERSHGKLHRTFDITGVDTSRISAHYKDGLLTLTLPKLTPTHNSVQTVEIHSSCDETKKQHA